MRLCPKSDDEKTIFDNKQVSLLGWAKVARKIESFLPKDGSPINACLNNDTAKQVDKAIHAVRHPLLRFLHLDLLVHSLSASQSSLWGFCARGSSCPRRLPGADSATRRM